MKKTLLAAMVLCILFSTSCKKDEGGSDYDNIYKGQSFSVDIDDTPWTTNWTGILLSYDEAEGYDLYVNSVDDNTYFGFGFPKFYGTDTTFNFPNVNFFFHDWEDYTFNSQSGSLHLTRSIAGDVETITGTFSGTYKMGSDTYSMTNGTFVAVN
jgi:hypothetical protein